MGWLVGLVVFIVLLVAFFAAPKQTLGCLGFIVSAVVALYYFAVAVPEQNRERLNSQVNIDVKYDIKSCEEDYPLYFSIENKSKKTLQKVRWNLQIYKPDYSTDISGYDNDYSSDKIIKSGQRWGACFSMPSSMKPSEAEHSALEYKIADKYASFE